MEARRIARFGLFVAADSSVERIEDTSAASGVELTVDSNVEIADQPSAENKSIDGSYLT